MLTSESITATLLRNQTALTAFFASITRGFHLAEDVFQEVCVAAIRHETGFQSEEHLIHWARWLGRNRAVDALRSKDGKYEGLTEDVLERLANALDHVTCQRSETMQEALRHCVQQLTPNNREILRLRYFEGLTSAAVAKSLDRRVVTVYQAIARIHKTLGQCISQQLIDLERA